MKHKNRIARYLVLFVVMALGVAWSLAFAIVCSPEDSAQNLSNRPDIF